MTQEKRSRKARWERRRAEILASAEELLAERGFAGTTLEAVAERVLMQRASLAYYFEDKEALYDAVLAVICEGLLEMVPGTGVGLGFLERIQAITSAWVDFLSQRPRAARLILRDVVDEVPRRRPETLALMSDVLRELQEVILEGHARGLFKRIAAANYATTLGGASLFWVSASPRLERALSSDPLSPENLESHRHTCVQLTRRLLDAPKPG